MSDYFILQPDVRIPNVVKLKDIRKAVDVNYIKTNQLQFLDNEPVMVYVEKHGIYPDFINAPVPLISDKLKTLFDTMNIKNIFYKPICIGDINRMSQVVYWLIIPRQINCLSPKTEFDRDGSLKALHLDNLKIGKSKIFKIQGILEDLIILHKDVATAMQENSFGCEFRQIAIHHFNN